jgi:hypothetical protein
MAPSNSMLKYFPLAPAGSANDLRYQPVPKMGSEPVCGLSLESNGPSIAQSWGSRTGRHAESSNSGFSAPAA